MGQGNWRSQVCAVVVCVLLQRASAQTGAAVTPPTTTEAALHALFRSAGVVFTGEVLSIDRDGGSVRIVWRVDNAVRGVSSGTYTQTEWSGLWAESGPRYVIGERALVLLHAPSAVGYSSPVGGADGIVPLRGNDASSTMDLRWIAQRVAVNDAARLLPLRALQAAGGSLPLSDALQADAALKAHASPDLQLPVDAGAAPSTATSGAPEDSAGTDGNAHTDGAMVLGMLRAWQRAEAPR